MLCTFTTKDGTLIIRSDDIRAIEDGADGTACLAWLSGDQIEVRTILGSAAENAARIQQEELDTISRVEEHHHVAQRRLQAGHPARPIQRGKQR